MTVHQIRPIRLPRGTIKCANKLHAMAVDKRVTGIAFVAHLADGGFMADACGDAYTHPGPTLEMLEYLAERLRAKTING
jgi:hypothetical protein